ncbi:DALR anticodon-binding domain-containing protein 3 [Pseudolycoriella hygida]|uniref:DALR anticodon-binding domain-containing protein 3 n=1 Tax=Pseudolycoriella hygida TaxID=35572 RepID=A0A9Q0RZA9_9DIPT|nr:DALR anticodon-binding domain-containing protein 3 [Pseudolycoriella hygida]
MAKSESDDENPRVVLFIFYYSLTKLTLTLTVMDRNADFIKDIFWYFLKDTSKYTPNNVIRKHSDKLTETGDYSVSIRPLDWAQFLPTEEWRSYRSIFCCREDCKGLKIENQLEHFVEHSQKWSLQIEKAVLKNNIMCIYVKRFKEFYLTLNSVLNYPDFGCYEGEHSYAVIKMRTTPKEQELLTPYRCRLIENVIENITKQMNGPSKVSLYVTHKSTDVDTPEGCTQIFVGNVVSNVDNKMMNMEASDYIKKRSIDMQLMAEHKYGLRVKNEMFFKNLIQKLGKAATTIDLLEVKPSCPIKLSVTASSGRSKGAAFILYNSARISTILKKYEERVESKYYPETPPLEALCLELLTEKEEWSLLFNYIFGYPSIISRTIGEIHKTKFSLHLLCSFLNELATTFSLYYGRIRILTDNTPHLMPVLHARIYLVKGIQIVLGKCLAHLNIDLVDQM